VKFINQYYVTGQKDGNKLIRLVLKSLHRLVVLLIVHLNIFLFVICSLIPVHKCVIGSSLTIQWELLPTFVTECLSSSENLTSLKHHFFMLPQDWVFFLISLAVVVKLDQKLFWGFFCAWFCPPWETPCGNSANQMPCLKHYNNFQ